MAVHSELLVAEKPQGTSPTLPREMIFRTIYDPRGQDKMGRDYPKCALTFIFRLLKIRNLNRATILCGEPAM